MRSATETLFSHICAKRVGGTIADLISEAALTQEDIDKIQEVLAKKKPFLKSSVTVFPGSATAKPIIKKINSKGEIFYETNICN